MFKTGTESGETNYTYDNIGNRLSYSTGNFNSTYLYTYDSADRLASATGPNMYQCSYEYDANGNQTKSSSSVLDGSTMVNTVTVNQYDCENRLKRTDKTATTGSASTYWAQYLYNGDGQLMGVLEQSTSGSYTSGNSVYYQYDGRQVIADRVGAGSVVASYTRMPGGKLLDKYAYLNQNLERDTYYTFNDILGSTVLLFGKTNGRTDTYRYDEFGSYSR